MDPFEAICSLFDPDTMETLAEAESAGFGRMLRGYADVQELNAEGLEAIVGVTDVMDHH
jgi:hypothetical protein